MKQKTLPYIEALRHLYSLNRLAKIKEGINALCQRVSKTKEDAEGFGKFHINGEYALINKSYLSDELNQILNSQTLERAKYYIKRLIKALTIIRTGKINDLNLNRWKEYSDIQTDSLWEVDKRDRSGVHSAGYWGNFIPQVPNQLLRRYTKSGEWLLDGFLGSGTSLIECKKLGRNGIGIELQDSIAKKAIASIEKEKTNHSTKCHVITGDSAQVNLNKHLNQLGITSVQFVLLHPPYWDIIKFSDLKEDLSNASTRENFLSEFGHIVDNCSKILDKGRFMAVVIGDKYCNGEWIPLGFETMHEVLQRDFTLKSIIVKNFNQTKAKRGQEKLWRYRALLGGFYVFKHEYIFLFKKKA
jgi:hypothetical protein